MGFNKYSSPFAGSWQLFDNVLLNGDSTRRSGQAMKKDIPSARVLGLSYQIDTETVVTSGRARPLHFIQIDGWEYTIRNDSVEFPVLAFSVLDMGAASLTRHRIQNLRVLSRPAKRCYRLNDKALYAAACMIRQISAGHVPDILRILSLYKLQPRGGFDAAPLPTMFNNRWVERQDSPYQH